MPGQYQEGQHLQGSDGKVYVVQGGVPRQANAAPSGPPAFIAGTPDPNKAAAEARAGAGEVRDERRLRLAEDAARRSQVKDAKESQSGTESENKASSFLIRAVGSNRKYEMQTAGPDGIGARSWVGQTMADYTPNALNALPGGIGNSPRRQVSDAAQNEFIAATLRQDSGAAIPPAELEAQRRLYFPMPGDGQSAIEAKKQARARAVAGLELASGKLRTTAKATAERMAPKPAGSQSRVIDFKDLP